MGKNDFGKCSYCGAKFRNEIETMGEICDKCLEEENKKLYRK